MAPNTTTIIVQKKCTACDGTGKKTKGVCQTCAGNGVTTHKSYGEIVHPKSSGVKAK